MLLSPYSFDSQEPVSEAKDLLVTLEKRTISYFFVSARIRVIDPFNQMKREYNTILDDADSANRNNFVPSQSFTWCSPGNFNFSRWPIASAQTSFGVRLSRIHFSPKWMRDERTPKDVCGEARWAITKCYLLRRALISNTDFFSGLSQNLKNPRI